jgi:succinate dehydrogenase / fumarate reductase flavoprotein subunit
MSNIPGLFVLGEANFSDHGANRLGASALMQGLADGYFVIPYTLPNYFANEKLDKLETSDPAFKDAEAAVHTRMKTMLSIKGSRTADSFHKELGKIMWDKCGMARDKAGLEDALKKIPKLREEFWQNVKVLGENESINQSLEKAGRVADFLEFGELMCQDALHREESCGGHFRTEHQTDDGEAKRNDEQFCYAGVWEHKGEGKKAELHKEALIFENVKLATRSYK